MRNAIGISGTVLIHVLVVFSLLDRFGGKANEIIPPQEPTDGVIRIYQFSDVLTDAAVELGNGSAPTELDCEETYIGVGLIEDTRTGIIDEVPEDLPAYKAGIRINDVYLNTEVDGKIATVYTLRNGVQIVYTITTQEICVEE